MTYIYYTAAFAGVAWTFYLIGQYTGLKEMNRRLNALVADNRDKQEEINRQSDTIANLQAKVPARNARGKFVAR